VEPKELAQIPAAPSLRALTFEFPSSGRKAFCIESTIGECSSCFLIFAVVALTSVPCGNESANQNYGCLRIEDVSIRERRNPRED